MKSFNCKTAMPWVTVVAGTFLACASASAATYSLRAERFVKTLPGGHTVPMWGFALDTDGNFATTAGEPATSPGPRLDLSSGGGGANLTLILKNNLPVPVSIVIPGQYGFVRSGPAEHVTFTDPEGRVRAESFVHETAPGAVGTYVWTAIKPGTFLYHSGSHPAVQVQMGLYGALTRPQGTGLAYPGIAYNAQTTVVFSAIDTNLNAAVDNGTYGTGPGMTMSSPIHSRPQFFLVNGEAFGSPAPAAIPGGRAGQTNLFRYVNACADAHAPALNGLTVQAVAEDGRPYPYARPMAIPYLPALKTLDVLVVPAASGRVMLYDRSLGLVNGAQPNGGMMRHVDFAP